MEICRLWQWCYIVISVIIISSICAKPFSINEAIAAAKAKQQKENRIGEPGAATEHKLLKKILARNHLIKTTKSNNTIYLTKSIDDLKEDADTLGNRISLKKDITSDRLQSKKPKNYRGYIIPHRKYTRTSPLKYKKAFELNIPLKPKKFKPYKAYYKKRRNQSLKRHTVENKYNGQYTPLFKNLGMLFDNLLNTDSIESTEYNKRHKYRKTISYATKDNDIVCQCSAKSKGNGAANFVTAKETTTSTESSVSEITLYHKNSTEVTTERTDFTTTSDVSIIGQDSHIPVLPSGNTISGRRNDNGIVERSSSARDWSYQGNITRNHGDGEHDSGGERHEADTKHNEESPCSPTRDGSSCSRPSTGTGGRNNRGNTTQYYFYNHRTDKKIQSENDSGKAGGNLTEFKVKNKTEIGGNETESPEHISGTSGRRLQGPLSENKEYNFTKPIQSIEFNETGNYYVGQYQPSYKRFIDGNGTSTREDQGDISTIPTVLNNFPSQLLNFDTSNMNNKKVVMIIDGYSIARGKNGDNAVSKRSIHIKS